MTRLLWLSAAKVAVFVTEIYPAGEEPIPGIDAGMIIDRIERGGKTRAFHAPSFEQMTDDVAAQVRDGDMVITMGAGAITAEAVTTAEMVVIKEVVDNKPDARSLGVIQPPGAEMQPESDLQRCP